MKVAVWDTYVKKSDGNTLHFDIIVPDSMQDSNQVYKYGKSYLSIIKEQGQLNAEECQFCHVESPSEEVITAIEQNGYYILDLGEIPASLPKNPTRRDFILHLRANYAKYRFANFREMSTEKIQKLLS